MRYPTLILLLLLTTALTAQDLPVLRATSEMADVRLGDELSRGYWTISPDVEIDPLYHNKLGERATFYTDQDSITTLVSEEPFDFYVLLNGKRALTRIVYQPSKLDLLKAAEAYVPQPEKAAPAFTYHPPGAAELVRLRETYQLDSIAGQGNEISRMLNLMRWVHNTVEHDGNTPNPGEIFNATALLETCTQNDKTLNCRGLAITLNDVYLAVGIPSRHVTCYPQDPDDFDCHVINVAWSEELRKWLWMDPTQNAYVMDETGTLLSIEEVRERLIDDRPLLLNPDANWNYRGTTTKAWYLEEYMAKNLYFLETPLESRPDYETERQGFHRDYVRLVPPNYVPDNARVEFTNEKNGGTTTKHYLTDPAAFWAPPVGKDSRKR